MYLAYIFPNYKIKFMRFLMILSLSYAFLFLFSCKNPIGKQTAKADVFGSSFEIENVSSFLEIWEQLDRQDTVRAVILARVSDVCKAKGCWMELVDVAEENENSIFVEFDDYSFFVPAHIQGKEVYVKGVFFTETSTVDELRFEAEMDGMTAEEIARITEAIIEKNMMASGVVLK
jgi:hypothetical protein